MNQTRLIWIDILKFSAVIGVILIHVSSLLLSEEYLFTSNWYQAVFISSLSRFAIVLFIMASGYLILRKQQPLSKIPERIKRILIPFIFWLIIYAIIKFFIKQDLSPNWNMLNLTTYIIEGFLNPTHIAIQFWYVYMILGLYLLSPILSRWIQNAPIKEIEYFIIIWAICSTMQFFELDTLILPYFRYFTGAIGYFILGYYLSIKDSPILKNRKNGIKFFIIGTLITFIGTITLSLITHEQSLFFIKLGDITPGACLQAIGLYIIIKNTNFNKLSEKTIEIIQKISEQSYGIYLSNVLIINLLEKLDLINITGFTLIEIILYSIIVLIISYGCIKLMNKIPILKNFT